MIGVTISSLDRVMACAASAMLPATRVFSSSPWASRGSVIHAFLRDVNQLGRDEALARVPLEHLEACEALELDALPVDPSAYAAEVALAYDWKADRGREINRGTDSREYGASPTEIAGRADVVALTPERVVILDYKTGYRYLGRADESWQLKGYALAAARAYGRREAEVVFVRLGEDGVPWMIRGELGFLELEEAALAITSRAESIERLREQGAAHKPELLEGQLKAGAHCRYCPAFGRCPEQAGLLREVVAQGEALARDGSLELALTPETASAVYRRLVLAQKALDYTRSQLEAYAEGGSIPVLDSAGLVWGPVSTAREEFDPIRGAAALGSRFGPELGAAAVEQRTKLTKASLERALRAWMANHSGEGHRITKLKDAALELLRTSEAVVVRRHTEFREHRPDIPIDESGQAAVEGQS